MFETLLWVALVLPALVCNTAAYSVGFRVQNATILGINGIYICSSDAKCTLAPQVEVARSSMPADIHTTYTLSSTNSFVNDAVQKRWFISKTPIIGDGGKFGNVNVYGAIELAAEPTLQLKAWKRLGTNGEFEHQMKMTPVGVSTLYNEALDENSVMSVLDSANILLAAYQHIGLDRKSDRGQFIMSTLQRHHHALAAFIEIDSIATDERQRLVQLFLCDYQAVLGAGSTADKCYQSAIAGLLQHIVANGAAVSSVILHGDLHYTALHCTEALEPLSCHVQYATMRQARHLLLHSVNPVRTLAVLQNGAIALRSGQSDVLQLLSYCLLGLCTNKHVTFDNAASSNAAQITFTAVSSTKSLTVGVDIIVRECDATLAVLQAHGGNDVIHTLFTKICFPFQQLQHRLSVATVTDAGAAVRLFSAEKRTLIDQSRTVVASLLSVGAVEQAALHTSNVLQYALGMAEDRANCAHISETTSVSPESINAELLRLVEAYPSLRLFVAHSQHSAAADALMRSPNVRATLKLSHLLRQISGHDMHWRSFLGSSDLLSSFLNTMFHATSPVILSTPAVRHGGVATSGSTATELPAVPVGWLQEAVLLRYIMVHTLRTLVDACAEGGQPSTDPVSTDAEQQGAKCEIIDPASSVGARGLFLLAYQGLGLLTETLQTTAHFMGSMASSVTPGVGFEEMLGELNSILRDPTVPSLYQDLIHSANSELNSIPPFQRTSHTPSATAAAPASCELDSSDHTCNLGVGSPSPEIIALPQTRRIKVAFLSYFFRRHPVGRLLAKIIVNLNSTQFDVHIITVRDNKQDDVTAYLRQHIIPQNWMYITHNMAAAANTVRQRQFDVIVYGDVFMDANMAHFATVRLAPVQVCFWGHPFTTGYANMDYFVTSDAFEQKQDKFRHSQYTEQLVRFDSLSYQLLEPEAETEAGTEPDTEPVSVPVKVTETKATGAAAVSAADADSGAPNPWPTLPAYSLRGQRSAWDDATLRSAGSFGTLEEPLIVSHTATSAYPVAPSALNAAPTAAETASDIAPDSDTVPARSPQPSDIDQGFFQRRLQVLRWVTSIGFDILDMPIDEANLIDTLYGASTSTATGAAEASVHTGPEAASQSQSGTQSVTAVVSGVRMYGALQSLFKMHPLFDLAIAEIMTRDKHAVVLLSRTGRQRHWEQSFRERLATTLRSYAGYHNETQADVSAQDIKSMEKNLLSRVLFVNQMQHAQYQRLLCSLDVTLDTFPFGGGVTLSDALGGCGLNSVQPGVYHNDRRDVYHRVVPFVTSGQLQSVHQIGAGMAEKLGPEMTDFAHRTTTADALLSGVRAEVYKCFEQGLPVTCVGSAMFGQVQKSHLRHIEDYCEAAVSLASKSQARKMRSQPAREVSKVNDTTARTRINDVLYNSLDAASEWGAFLQNIVALM